MNKTQLAGLSVRKMNRETGNQTTTQSTDSD